jgi:hypothetical protein
MMQIRSEVNNFQLDYMQLVAIVATIYGVLIVDVVRKLHGDMQLQMGG